jgi:hypothetical protein
VSRKKCSGEVETVVLHHVTAPHLQARAFTGQLYKKHEVKVTGELRQAAFLLLTAIQTSLLGHFSPRSILH